MDEVNDFWLGVNVAESAIAECDDAIGQALIDYLELHDSNSTELTVALIAAVNVVAMVVGARIGTGFNVAPTPEGILPIVNKFAQTFAQELLDVMREAAEAGIEAQVETRQ